MSYGDPAEAGEIVRPRKGFFPKGRRLDEADVAAVRALLGDRPRQRDLLIEYLHLIQDSEGCIPAGMLHALAEELRIPMAEAYEVATFYHHFDVLRDGEARPAPLTIRVCDSVSCMMAGAEALIAQLKAANMPSVRIEHAPCMGACDKAPACAVGHRQIGRANVDSVRAAASGSVKPEVPAYQGLEAYRAAGGYRVLQSCLSGARKVEDVIATLSDGGLRGLGGAGFPTGRKWGIVRGYPGPRLMAVNADEGEPGTFKDRYFLEQAPHQFLEGVLIAAWAVEASDVYIYLRDEYPAIHTVLAAELPKLVEAGLAPHTKLHLRRGAGAYICGEESSMIESIEGKRGLPRHRPPYVAEFGIFGRPTLVNNVETLYWVPKIIENGADWFAGQGKNGAKGLRSYSVSGRVKHPGVIITAAGSTVRDLIALAGGMEDGHSFKAYLPGGASGGILPASLGDEPLDFGRLEKYGCFVGSHAVVILSDKDDTKDIALNLMQFFADESCGQCTPCRNGTEKAVALMQRRPWNDAALRDLAQVMADASICGLGQAAPNPLLSVFKFFPEDLR